MSFHRFVKFIFAIEHKYFVVLAEKFRAYATIKALNFIEMTEYLKF
jgi:hypothetical protein